MRRSKSVVDLLLFPGRHGDGGSGGGGDKCKNIRQTEVLISLRDAILRVGQYFQAADPSSFAEVKKKFQETVNAM